MSVCACNQVALVPRQLTAGVPREVRDGDEGRDQVEDGPGDDDAVVDVQEEDHHHGGNAHSCKQTSFLLVQIF